MRFISAIALFGTCFLVSCTHQRAATLRYDQLYKIPCKPYAGQVRVGDDGFVSFTYTISPTEVLEVQCKGNTTFIGQVVPAPNGRTYHVTAYDGTNWKTNAVTFTNRPNTKAESRTTH